MKIFVIGSLNMDLVIKTHKLPKLGETVKGSSFSTYPGGKGANQALATKRFLCDTYMVGVVGNPFGDTLLKSLHNYHVNTQFVDKNNHISSGVAVITIAEQDNTIILDAGTNDLVSEELIDQALESASPGDYVLLQNEIPRSKVEYAIKKAKSLNLVTVLNPAPAVQLDLDIFKFIDYLILNETETEYYTHIHIKNEHDIDTACKYLKDLGVKHVIVTLGQDGSLYYHDQPIKTKAHRVDVIDTTAAGDTFIGAFISCISKNDSIEYALQFATSAAALAIMKEGAQTSIPSYDEVVDYMSKHPL